MVFHMKCESSPLEMIHTKCETPFSNADKYFAQNRDLLIFEKWYLKVKPIFTIICQGIPNR